jgi:ribonuclease Z
MIATKALALFDQDYFQFGPHFSKRKRNEPARKTTADNGQITFDIFERHAAVLAQPFYKGKGSATVIHSFMCGSFAVSDARCIFPYAKYAYRAYAVREMLPALWLQGGIIMQKKWLLAVLGAVAVAGGIAYTQRDAIAMALITRAADSAMARNVMAELPADQLHVGFCGTGSPLPSRDRAAACTVVIADGRLFVFDMGEGSGETLSLMGMPLDKVQGVWLTHLHSDHFEGLGPFTLQRWAGTSAKTPLPVSGPEGVTEITQGLNAAYRIDSTYRVAHHGEAVVPLSGFGMVGAAVQPGTVYDANGVRITAFAVDHDPIKPAFGYRVDYKGKSVTITGDTAFTPKLAVAAKGSDILVSELLSPRIVDILANSAQKAGMPNRAKIFDDIQNYHISPELAGDVAKSADVGMLAFTHIVPSVPKMLEFALLGKSADRYDGPISVMHDGDVVSIVGPKQFKTRNLLKR